MPCRAWGPSVRPQGFVRTRRRGRSPRLDGSVRCSGAIARSIRVHLCPVSRSVRTGQREGSGHAEQSRSASSTRHAPTRVSADSALIVPRRVLVAAGSAESKPDNPLSGPDPQHERPDIGRRVSLMMCAPAGHERGRSSASGGPRSRPRASGTVRGVWDGAVHAAGRMGHVVVAVISCGFAGLLAPPS